LELL
jgi:hypothetical protein